jgi:tRNA(His) 5'-end guanylyltransferase
MQDPLGDIIKEYEAQYSSKLMPQAPAFARLDGRAFHSFTRELNRPFDGGFTSAMCDLALYMAKENDADCVYTQSDEITLSWYRPDPKSELPFGGKTNKLNSILAAQASVFFNELVHDGQIDVAKDSRPVFDCRSFSAPSVSAACMVFAWREHDATKNSLQMLARSHFSYKQLENKTGREMHEILHARGVNWNDLEPRFKRGTFYCRRNVKRKFTKEELEQLPPKHQARTNPDLEFERQEYRLVLMPPFTRVTNQTQVLYEGADPQTLSSE